MCRVLSDKENLFNKANQNDFIIYFLFYSEQCKSDIRNFTEV